MADNIYERIHRALTWKRIVAFNMLLFLVTAVPLSVRIAQQDTENRSGAAGEEEVIIPPPSYPTEEPKIDRVTEFFGKKGDTIVVLGKNYGDYKWDSKVYVGNVEARDTDVVRWSNNVIEVQIPEGARTGKVWVVVDGKQANWDGSLLLYDVARAAQIGIKKVSGNFATIWVSNGAQIVRGMVEIGHVGELQNVTILNGNVTAQNASADSLGKKTKIDFSLNNPLSSNSTDIISLEHPGIGNVELIRIELYDQNGALVPVYADPLGVKVTN